MLTANVSHPAELLQWIGSLPAWGHGLYSAAEWRAWAREQRLTGGGRLWHYWATARGHGQGPAAATGKVRSCHKRIWLRSEWVEWARELPAGGWGLYTKAEWLDWMMACPGRLAQGCAACPMMCGASPVYMGLHSHSTLLAAGLSGAAAMGAPTPHSCGMASGCDGSVGHAFCVQGCGRLAFAPRFSDCCQACPVSHTNQCGFRQPPLCCFGCGRLANRPRHTSCCRQCPAGHTGECETRQGASRERPDDAQRPSHAGEEWVWVSAEHGLFLERGAIVGPPLPAGTLTSGDRGIMPRACGAVFICQLPRLEVRGFRNEGPTGTLDLREGLRHCFGLAEG
jgi:hypothetical protein